MHPILTLAVACAAATTGLCAHAEVLDATFSGTVASQTNTSFVLNAPVSGEFVYDTASARFLSFSVGAQSVAAGFASTAVVTPDLYSAIYRAQLSPVPQGGKSNSSFSVDLEGVGPWPSNDAVALLHSPQIATNLDTTLSSFGFYTAHADGTGVRSMSAVLSSIRVSPVPEPGTVLMLLAGLGVIATRRRLRVG